MDGVDEPCSPTPPTGHQHQSGHLMCYEGRTSSRALDRPRTAASEPPRLSGKTAGPDRASELCVQAIYGIGRVQQPAHLSGEGIERTTSPQARRQLGAMAAYLRAPRAFLKGTQGGLCGFRVHGAVNL